MDYKSALALIRKGTPVSLEWSSLDLKRNTGGKVKSMKNMELTGSSHNRKSNGTITMRQIPNGDPVTIHTKLIHKVNGEMIY